MKYIVWFKELDKNSIPIAGGKGANLGEMYNLGLPIPPGFCITAQTYNQFIEEAGIKTKINSLLKNLDINNTAKLQQTAEEVQKLIVSTKISSDIEEAIKHAYEILGSDVRKASELIDSKETFVAVRSSATAEDLPEASFAGQQATFLNVKGKTEVVKAVRDCWASLFTARAIYYRQKNKFPHDKVLISAIIQVMVNSEQSGVMFTVNPATNNPAEIVIEAIYGLGEYVVGGKVNPNLYLVDKKTRTIKTAEIKKQEVGLFRDEKGNNLERSIPAHQQKQQVIPDTIIKELARYGQKIETHYGQPQDIEWAIEKGEVFIVQTRAVTTFKEMKEERPVIQEEVGNGWAMLHFEKADVNFVGIFPFLKQQVAREMLKRGVKIMLIVPCKSDNFLVDVLRDRYLGRLYNEGINIYYYKPSVLHAKLLIVDDKFFLLGSSNIDYRSFIYQYEINFFGKNIHIISALKNHFEETLSQSELFNYSEWKKRSSLIKTLELFMHSIRKFL